MRVANWTAVGLAVMAGGGWASGQMTYLSQTRSVRAETELVETFSNTSLLEWTSSASSSYLIFATASAWQTSNLQPDRISLRSRTRADNQNAYRATSSSALTVTFTLLEATPYEIAQDPLSPHYWQAMVRMTSGATTIFDFYGTPISGVLDPGTYRLNVQLTSTAVPGGPDYIYYQDASFILNVPSPGAVGVFAFVGLAAAARRRR